VPQERRQECVFAFEVEAIEKIRRWNYAADAGAQLLPVLNRNSTCSILTGQLSHPDQRIGLALLDRYLRKHRPLQIIDVAQLYCIYLNNLGQSMLDEIHSSLVKYEPYAGFIPLTYSSPIKTWLSSTLGARYLKTRHRMLSEHEDDVSNDENVNLPSWPLNEHGYQSFSLQSIYFQLFLTYKIERSVYAGFEVDTRFALNSISDLSLPLHGLDLVIEEEKLRYLQDKKAGSLGVAGIGGLTASGLRDLIISKMRENYIYNLRFLAEHNVSLFDIILEIVNPERMSPVKLMVALAYQPDERLLQLVTLY
jgi:hypothetical protein